MTALGFARGFRSTKTARKTERIGSRGRVVVRNVG